MKSNILNEIITTKYKTVENLFPPQVWIFDQEGGGARLLRIRQGHSAPPTTIHHHGNDGKNILSAGKIR